MDVAAIPTTGSKNKQGSPVIPSTACVSNAAGCVTTDYHKSADFEMATASATKTFKGTGGNDLILKHYWPKLNDLWVTRETLDTLGGGKTKITGTSIELNPAAATAYPYNYAPMELFDRTNSFKAHGWSSVQSIRWKENGVFEISYKTSSMTTAKSMLMVS
jgi:hypothetical protein